ncbi:MAG TPA: alpha/beta hydrolase [Gammaproteobacteria bacterium]|nr:alpha/beta hydrolase [Gammaproteobacteria bacterium]
MKPTGHATHLKAVLTFLLIWVLLPKLAPCAMRGYSMPGKLVYVRDHYMHINCMGKGHPTVVLDSGLGGTSLDWALIQPKVAHYTRVCSYDRSGYGWSDGGLGPRTSFTIMDELHLLLDAANVPGPYVLVGHSFGGFNMRLFANAHPEDTAGLVLVDASHEQQFMRLEKPGSGPSLAPQGPFVIFAQPKVPSGLPRTLQPVALALMSTPASYIAVSGELAGLRQSAMEVAHHEWLPQVPIVVVTRGRRVWPKTAEGDRKEAIWRNLQNDLAHRNRQSVHLIAHNSGHYIPLEQPDVVSNAICIAIGTARADNGLHDGSASLIWLKHRCHL